MLRVYYRYVGKKNPQQVKYLPNNQNYFSHKYFKIPNNFFQRKDFCVNFCLRHNSLNSFNNEMMIIYNKKSSFITNTLGCFISSDIQENSRT